MADQKKFLDYEGVKHLWSKINMQDYPNNETLMAVINAIDETKADRSDIPEVPVTSVNGMTGDVVVEQVQADWNQNDSTAADYVKNRPFYTGDPVETVLVEDTTASFDDGGGVYYAEITVIFKATVGETYKVSWDGTVYECTCVDYDFPCIGNLSIVDDYPDTGEPFVIYVFYNSIEILTKDTSASHTVSISGIVAPIVKIPAKYIDKNGSGYIAIHSNDTMTEQEAENYMSAIEKKEVVFIKWALLCIKRLIVNRGPDLFLETLNNEFYRIKKNSEGLFNLNDRMFRSVVIPNNTTVGEITPTIHIVNNTLEIWPNSVYSGVGSTDVLFQVQPNGTKSKDFNVLGNGEAVTPALILYSSTADSTKKFRVTVDDSGTISATEVT